MHATEFEAVDERADVAREPLEGAHAVVVGDARAATSAVVGRDHAGLGDYYGPLDAHHIFDQIDKGSLEIQPLKIDVTFHCYKCEGMATGRTCPHGEEDRLNISGTRLREMFANTEPIPKEFSRPEVLDVLQAYYDKLD